MDRAPREQLPSSKCCVSLEREGARLAPSVCASLRSKVDKLQRRIERDLRLGAPKRVAANALDGHAADAGQPLRADNHRDTCMALRPLGDGRG